VKEQQQQQQPTSTSSSNNTDQAPPLAPSIASPLLPPQPPVVSPSSVSSAGGGLGIRPPSPSYAGPSRRVGGGAPSRPGSAPLNKQRASSAVGSPSPQTNSNNNNNGFADNGIITTNASYVERWMKNLYSRQEQRRQQRDRGDFMFSGSSSNAQSPVEPMARTQTDPGIGAAPLRQVDENALPPRSGKQQGFSGAGGRSQTPAGGATGSRPSSGVYRPPRGGSASRFRSEVSGMKPLPSQTTYVLPRTGSASRVPRHRQAVADQY